MHTSFSVDRGYFDILNTQGDRLVIKSKCTGHTWMLIFLGQYRVDIFHKHRDGDKFHWHQTVSTFEEAVDEIQGHDEFQINGRRPVFPVYTREGVVIPQLTKRAAAYRDKAKTSAR